PPTMTTRCVSFMRSATEIAREIAQCYRRGNPYGQMGTQLPCHGGDNAHPAASNWHSAGELNGGTRQVVSNLPLPGSSKCQPWKRIDPRSAWLMIGESAPPRPLTPPRCQGLAITGQM